MRQVILHSGEDGYWVAGSVDRLPNVVAATGHSMTGVTLCPVTGKLVSQLVTGEVPLVTPRRSAPPGSSSHQTR